jgi:segregation and condensation protein A
MHEEPVEILVAMAERGEIDPWNVDIVEVTDRFLSELERLKEIDLRISGRTLFFAATLLRMKSEYLEGTDEEGEEFLEDIDDYTDDFGFDDAFSVENFTEPIERLEREIQRRIGRKRLRKQPVTLYELIKELKTAEKEERRRYRKRKVSPPLQIEVEDIVDLAHEENFEDAIASVLECFEKAKLGNEIVTLQVLSSETGLDLWDIYIPLLFLMLEGKLLISQDEFFGEIRISSWST